jgi:hypothetical protein
MADTPVETLAEVSMSCCVPRCLHVVAELGIADALNEAPSTAGKLAAATGANAGALSRVLRVLAAHGVFQASDGGWVHTPASRLLRSDHPQSMRSFVRSVGNPFFWDAFKSMEHSVRTGLSAGEKVVPGGLWRWLGEHPEDGRLFNEAMTGKAHGQIAGVVGNYDFSGFRTIGDIGGGRGHLLQAVLAATPQVKGVLFDLPEVVAQASGAAPDRLRLQAGDFFKDPLPVCDCYVIMQVIHDWSDEESLRILSAIRRAAPVGAKLKGSCRTLRTG